MVSGPGLTAKSKVRVIRSGAQLNKAHLSAALGKLTALHALRLIKRSGAAADQRLRRGGVLAEHHNEIRL